MGNKITICHFDNEVGHWNAIEVSTNALSGHDNHDLDIWAPYADDPDGHNWPEGEAVYLNGCVLASVPEASPSATPSESGTASPTPTLPETGAGENWAIGIVGVALIGAGAWMKWRAVRND